MKSFMRMTATLFVLCTVTSIVMTATASAIPPVAGLNGLHFRFLGPIGNRTISVVGVPGDPNVAYYGAASGGIWKTVDGGVHFKPIFDSQGVSAIGALAIAPSDTKTIWAGTGETSFIRPMTSPGDGVYKSVDAGTSWQHMGLDSAGYIRDIAINPKNPNVVFVCALGQITREGHEGGVYRTNNGGQTWKLVLKANKNTGCQTISMSPDNSNVLFAGMWNVLVTPWDLNSGGTKGGVYETHDGGATWTHVLGHGLPEGNIPLGKIAVRFAPTNAQVVYALMQGPTGTGLLYRSSNGGKKWTLVHKGIDVIARAPYFTNFAVSTGNENELLFTNSAVEYSLDGGKTIKTAKGMEPSAGGKTTGTARGTLLSISGSGRDIHDYWFDPKDPQRLLMANDMGGAISGNGGHTWFQVELPIAQIYHVYADSNIPYNVVGNRQDTGGQEGPSRSLAGGFGGGSSPVISTSSWHGYAGCESGFGVPDPIDPNIIWSDCYDGDLVRVNLATGEARNVTVWPMSTYGTEPSKVRDRWNWTFPIAISPFNHNDVYVGSQYVYETTDAGQNWKRISPDLTTDSHLTSSGGLTLDNLMTFEPATLSIINESPVKKGVIWAGSYDGQVSVTTDGGRHWINVTKNIKGLPPWGTINLQASPFDAGTAYISSNLYLTGNYNPYIFETTDYGKTWTSISGDLPRSLFSYVHVVREDPVRKGLLYAGTENGLYLSWDNGQHWAPLKNNLPPAPVYWIQVQPKFSDLLIATYGRGIWVLDDVTPLRSWDKVSQLDTAHLFQPRDAYRFRTTVTQHQESLNSAVVGQNIPYGADINYYLPEAGKVVLNISRGQTVIRTLHVQGKKGLNRVFWDLRYPPRLEAKLLTNPPGKPWVNTPSTGRPINIWGAPSMLGPLVSPGQYTVSLVLDGSTKDTANLAVLRDPHTEGTQSTMEAQEKFLLKVEDEIDQTVRLINGFEVVRKELGSIQRSDPKVQKAAAALAQKAFEIENRLFAVGSEGTGKSFRWYSRVYLQLGDIYNALIKQSANLGPTTAQIRVNDEVDETLRKIVQVTNEFNERDVVQFNALAMRNGVRAYVTPVPIATN